MTRERNLQEAIPQKTRVGKTKAVASAEDCKQSCGSCSSCACGPDSCGSCSSCASCGCGYSNPK